MKQVIFAVGISLATVIVSAQDVTDKMVGTWKIRTDKFMPPDDTIAAGTNVVTKTAPHTIRTVSKQVLKNGEKRHSENVQVCDGQEHANPSGPAGITSVCDPETGDFTIKRDGKMVMDVKRELSTDGKLVTFRRHRLDNLGKWIDDIRVWEKQ